MKRRTSIGAIAFAVAMSTVAAQGWAAEGDQPAQQDLGRDEVTIKNGGTVRGTIITYEPGEDVVIKVYGKDEPRRIGWAEVADVERGKYASQERPAAAPPGPAGAGYQGQMPAPAAPEIAIEPNQPGVVRLHIESDDPDVALIDYPTVGAMVSAHGVHAFTQERTLCVAPCDLVVDARRGGTIEFAGDGVSPSDHVPLSGMSGDVTAVVSAGSNGVRKAGKALTITGIAVGAVGGVVMILSLPLDDSRVFDAQPMLIGGAIGAGVGVLCMGLGIPLWTASSTDFELKRTSQVEPRTVAGNPLSWVW